MIDQEYLKSLLHYCPETGIFTRTRTSSRMVAGEIAGNPNGSGYLRISVANKDYRAHRLAFIWMTGECPEYVDHINGNRSDNRWANLRAATNAENNRNRKPSQGSSSRYLGVTWRRNEKKWAAQIRIEGKQTHLGYFTNERKAAQAYDKAAARYHGEFANLNFGGPNQ